MIYKTQLKTPYKQVTWECTTVCNYSCSYCWPHLHDGKYRWPSKIQTQNLISYLHTFSAGEPIVLDIMGGEPTLWPELRDFCKTVSDFCHITFSTNGSRSLRYWEKFNVPLDHLLFSFHPETASAEHFLNILEKIQNKFYITVLILYHPDYIEECEYLFNMIDYKKLKIEVKYKLIDSTEKKVLTDKMKINITKKINRNECIKTSLHTTDWLVDGVPSDADDMIKNRTNMFKGYKCFVGEHYRYITANGNIHGASCSIAPLLGNIYSTDEKTMPQPIICTLNNCHCHADITLNKKCYTQE